MPYSIKVFEFTAVVRGYRHYRKFWKPEHQQVLHCYREKNNAFGRFAIMVCEIGNDEKHVGHLPMEISRATKFFIDRGATLTAELKSDRYRRSPLIQGGMEIPCKNTAKISGSYQLAFNGEIYPACEGTVQQNLKTRKY